MQVHQTKKSNKWECKLCGEKQSIKRHYGIGTGKECRLQVQKLNTVRGEVEEMDAIAKLNESSDEELLAEDKSSVLDKKQTNLKSKWSEFVDNTESSKEPKQELMCFGNAEVVLDIPAKRKKFTKFKATKKALVPINNYSQPSDTCSIQQSEFQISNSPIVKDVETNDVQSNEINKQMEFIKPKTNAFVPLKVDRNSKWSQFADESDAEPYASEYDRCPMPCNYEISTVTSSNTLPNNDGDFESCKDEYVEKVSNDDKLKNIFSLCNESEIDDVLNF